MTPSEAYAHCLGVARRHYENFPVASHALPAALRGPVAAIYAFARTADDYADEGDRTAPERLDLLAAYRAQIDDLETGVVADDPVFVALNDVRERYRLPLEPLRDLLRAFSQDVTRTRYADFDDVLAYCRWSANPVGRLLLHLYRWDDPADVAHADMICTALQLVNFLQDLAQDYAEHGRIYLPGDEMRRLGVTEAHFAGRLTDAAMLSLVSLQAARAACMLEEGAPLAWRLPGRLGLELRLIVVSAHRIVGRIARERTDCFSRPRLLRRDWPLIAWQAATARGIAPLRGQG